MRFSFLVAITALAVSMYVSACSDYGDPCLRDSDCCGYPTSALFCPFASTLYPRFSVTDLSGVIIAGGNLLHFKVTALAGSLTRTPRQ
jgi:hypothetical protein